MSLSQTIQGEPTVLWISGLHIPETYLAALVQISCRRNNWPLDRSTLFTKVTEYTDTLDITERPDPVSYWFKNAFTVIYHIYFY